MGRTANTDLPTWIIDEALKTLPEGHVDKGKSTSEFFESALWSQLGQGADALIAIDDSHVAYYGSGAMATLQDMARFGSCPLCCQHLRSGVYYVGYLACTQHDSKQLQCLSKYRLAERQVEAHVFDQVATFIVHVAPVRAGQSGVQSL